MTATFDIVIHNGTVLTVNDGFDIFEPGLVCIADGVLVRVERYRRETPLPAGRLTLDAKGGIVMPGLVNTHTHSPMSLFRGLADDLPLMTWLNDHMFKAEARWINPETVYPATCLSCAEMLLSGTTTCCDGYFFEGVVAEAMEQSGMRAVLGQGIVDFPAPGVSDPAKNVAEALRFIEQWKGRNARILPGIFCHSPYTCSDKTLKEARRIADETDSLFQIHVAETQGEAKQIGSRLGLSPVQYLDRLGVLNARTLAVHAIWVDRQDMETLADRRVGVSVTPESEMKLASGVAPVPAYLEHGVTVGLGTDGCASNNNLDMFQEMDSLAKLHKVIPLDPTTLDAKTVLTLATRGGADAIGLGAEIGSLELGKRADVIVIDTAKPHLVPLYDPVSQLVYSANGGDVRDVIVDGKVVVRDRVVQTIPVGVAMAEVSRLARQIAAFMTASYPVPEID